MCYFFETADDRPYQKLTRMRTPTLAKEWGFWMNTGLEDFAACLHKFLPRHETVL